MRPQCICKGRQGHIDPACPWYGTDTPPYVTLPPGVLCDAPNGDEPHAPHGKCPGLIPEVMVPDYIKSKIDTAFQALKNTDAYAEADIDTLLAYAKADVLTIISGLVEDMY